jgi:hypothetical protein
MSSCRTRLTILGTFGAIAVSAAITAPDAKADQYDFIEALDNQGTFYKDINDMIDDGKVTCSLLRRETPLNVIVGGLVHRADFNVNEASRIIVAAANTMWPDTWPLIHAALNPPPPPPPPADDAPGQIA